MYNKCDYIESTGSQYIDTGFVPNNNTSVEMRIAFTDISANQNLFCARGDTTKTNTYSCFLISGSGIRFDYYGSVEGQTRYIPTAGNAFDVKAVKNKVYINDVIKYTYSGTSFTSGGNMWLLASYVRSGSSYGNVGNFAKAKLYYCKIYDGYTLVRNFVPVVDTESGKAGLYDNVNGKFYTSKGSDFKYTVSYTVNYTDIADIVSGVANSIQLVSNAKYDENSYTISGLPDYVKYKGTSVSTIYANGNSWIGLGTEEEHFKFNRRDAAMYNLWTEEGTLLDTYRFFRIRWDGVCKYDAYGDPYFQTFDLLIFDTGDVMFYAVDIPTQYYDGTFAFADVEYNAPTTDARYTTFYAQADGTYRTVYAPIEFSPASVYKYLVRDGNTLYTVTDGTLAVVEGDLTADLFVANGVDVIPDGTLLLPLDAPEVLCWTDADELPRLTATVHGNVTGKHEIVSDDINVGHNSITGVKSLVVIADDGAEFYLSFDGGEWMVYDASNGTWVVSSVGMSAAELAALPTDVWQSVANSVENMWLKAVIEGIETVTQVKFTFDNA